MNKFVLVGGASRSGTNLIRRIIGSHSKIAIPTGEFNFFSKYVKGKSVREILANKRLEKWNVDFSDLYSCEHREVFVNTLVRYTKSIGKEIPGEKTPYNEFYYDIIQEWLSDFELKFVHIVRNPLDVMASIKHSPFHHKHHKNDSKISVNSRKWQRSVSLGLARSHFNPEGYCLLKYEDLVADPIGITQKLCAFLGVDFEKERMLNLSDYSGHKDNTSFPQITGQKHQGYKAIQQPESRKSHLKGSEIRIISSVCGELARALGYDDIDFRSFSPEYTSSGIAGKLKQLVRIIFLPS